ncbi:MAG: bifunctional 3-deoxy-7-phosphoheptulonate synthase/chorismate mutase [Bacteroidales bacterium]
MIIQLNQQITSDDYKQLLSILNKYNFNTKKVRTQLGIYLIALGNTEFDIRIIGNLKGVKDVHAVNDKHKLVSRKWKTSPTSIDLGDNHYVGGGDFSIIAGPCSVENEAQIHVISDFLKEKEISIMRGGVFKPRSSPYSFRGVGIEGLQYFAHVCHEKNIKIISEVMQEEMIQPMYPYVDIFQVGARNSQNFNLLDALGKIDKPVLLKRGISGTIDELLYSAEYIFSGGNEKIILCERGIRTYEKAYRNTLDLNAVALLKEKTHLPVIVDPSHGTGIRELVEPMTLASIMSGADGVMLEMHQDPQNALSDGQQSLSLKQTGSLLEKINATVTLHKKM